MFLFTGIIQVDLLPAVHRLGADMKEEQQIVNIEAFIPQLSCKLKPAVVFHQLQDILRKFIESQPVFLPFPDQVALADIFAFAFLLAYKHGFDVKEIVLDKIRKNGLKYPVEKSKNSATKYTDL